jgi:hypothetical protein
MTSDEMKKKFMEDQLRQARERLAQPTDDKYKQAMNAACLSWNDRVKKGEVKPLSQQGAKFENK